jgi:hypothetical protein
MMIMWCKQVLRGKCFMNELEVKNLGTKNQLSRHRALWTEKERTVKDKKGGGDKH